MDTSESWGQRPSKSKTIEEQSCFFHGHFGELGSAPIAIGNRRARPSKRKYVFLWTLRGAGAITFFYRYFVELGLVSWFLFVVDF
jgi:hypothetical protein